MTAAQAPEIRRNADLTPLSTFRLSARAAELVAVDTPEQLLALPPPASEELVLGGGSNTVFMGDYPGRIILNRLRGIRFEAAGDDRIMVHAAAGENWHQLVGHCLRAGAHGLENLAMIPGCVGAAPMQNIGAYGVELSDRFEALTALDRQRGEFVRLSLEDCGFDYRDSRFKSAEPGRFLISEVTLRLSRRFEPRTDYASLAESLQERGHTHPRPRQLMAAVMRLRRHRLPDPKRLANAGSFFKNPIVDSGQARRLLDRYPELPQWPAQDGRIKLAAAWMIERLGWRGRSLGRVGVYGNHALVLVNHGGASAAELLDLVDAIQTSVQETFGLRLEPEPRLIGRPNPA